MRYLKILIAIIGLFKCNFGFCYDFEVDGIYYNKLSDNEVEVTSNRLFDHNTYSGNIIIPSEVFYSNITYKVTSIGYRAMDSQNISNVELPNTIVSIGEQAFMGCDKITSLYIPSSVKNIGNSAFYLCDALESIELPDQVTNIGTEIFSGCKRRTRIFPWHSPLTIHSHK
jgi:hypothetical protein